eukprot:scaffold20114_cov178-Skeletonema_marinoi.AAC.2
MAKAPKILKRSESKGEEEHDDGTANSRDEGINVALSWFLHNNCTSNVQLATLSNVCRGWRKIATDAVASEALELANDDNVSEQSSTLRTLLVTDMARGLVIRQKGPAEDNNTDGSFCLAWFAPSGIQLTSVSLEDDDDDGNDGGAHVVSITKTTKSNSSSKKVTCCNEWRGYTHASEVLIPMGFATSFVHGVFDATSKLAFGEDTSPMTTTSSSSLSPSTSSSSTQNNSPSHEYNTTFSVRGASLARPEGFCLCLDGDYIEHTHSSNFQKPPHASTEMTPSNVDDWMVEYLDDPSLVDEGLSSTQRAKKQRDLGRILLPRVIMSTRRKYPLLHRFADTDDDRKLTQPSNGNKLPRLDQINPRGSPHKHLPFEKRQRSVQFFNPDRSQAVRMITPKFDCGPVDGPITAFVVAVSTEDGCFFSGRSCRYEFGHMYPTSSRDMQNDMSPICIATGKNTEGKQDKSRTKPMPSRSFDSSSEDDVDSSFSDQSMHCLCKFDSGDPFQPRDPSVDDTTEDCTYRGRMGPGLWHCYTAVFDGQNSIIRVDGSNEPSQTREDFDDEDDIDDADKACNASKYVGSGSLDGLTIGSDHQFDMSLCYGEIEGESGQGAIAELAIFKGRMEQDDIEQVEKHLMEKHGILSAKEKVEYITKENSNRSKPINIESHWQEDEWTRQAHALIDQRPPWKLVSEPIPLRVLANHPTVVWQRVSQITGVPMRIARIGARKSNGSSDW